MYSWWWVRLSPETCRVKPLRRIKTQLLHLVGLISLATISFAMSARPSVYPSARQSFVMEQIGSHFKDFHEIWYFSIFRKTVDKISFIQIGQKLRVLYMKSDIHFWSYLTQVYLGWKCFRQICGDNRNTRFMFNNFFFSKLCRLWNNVEKYCRVEQATDDNMAYGHCMLDT